MTGPEKPIEDERGLFGLVSKFELPPFGGAQQDFAVTRSSLKYFLSEYHSQAPITAALALEPRVPVDEIAAVRIDTQWFTYYEIGSEPEKWHPTTRETADHSLPWIIAAVLIDGSFSDEIFSAARLGDPRIHALTDKISVQENTDFTRVFPQEIHCRIEVATTRGERIVSAVKYPRGHVGNPMTDAEVETKFRPLAARTLAAKSLDALLELLWDIDRAAGVDALFAAMAGSRST